MPRKRKTTTPAPGGSPGAPEMPEGSALRLPTPHELASAQPHYAVPMDVPISVAAPPSMPLSGTPRLTSGTPESAREASARPSPEVLDWHDILAGEWDAERALFERRRERLGWYKQDVVAAVVKFLPPDLRRGLDPATYSRYISDANRFRHMPHVVHRTLMRVLEVGYSDLQTMSEEVQQRRLRGRYGASDLEAAREQGRLQEQLLLAAWRRLGARLQRVYLAEIEQVADAQHASQLALALDEELSAEAFPAGEVRRAASVSRRLLSGWPASHGQPGARVTPTPEGDATPQDDA